ncbi:MAG: AMP-binding protein [Acidobacteriaceae bacterium]|nr:AMP-binding protein [Acidobacteriaceae bacterium]
MTLSHLFDLSLHGRCDQVALEFQGAVYTFGKMETRSNRVAHWMRAQGFERGDRCSVYLTNCVEIIDVFLACVKLGVIFVPINILYRGREIAHILNDAEPRAIISDTPLETAIAVFGRNDLRDGAAAQPESRPSVTLEGDTPAGIIYTSGTTGVSKGAILSHNNFAVNAINLLTIWQITAADRFLLSLPLFHVHGLGNGLVCWLASGCRMRLLERFEHAKAAAEFLDFRPTLFFGVPTMYVRLLEVPAEQARQIGAFMRLFVCGSAPLPAQVLAEFRERFGHTILERYGMSETLMNMSNPYVGERRPGSVGVPLPGVSARIFSPEGEPVADGQTGELYLKGPNVFLGYWRREQATRDAFRDGYFRTGDLASRESDGYYTLCGRKSDLIISAGFNIYPREIEEFLLEFGDIQEAAVVGVPDALKGEVPVAYIVASGAFDSATLESRCREKLASFKVPRSFIRVDALPRNAMGKIQKHLLAAPETQRRSAK